MSKGTGNFDASEVLKGIDKTQTDWKDRVNRGLWKAGEYLRGQSQMEVPHDEGDLEASADVSQDKGNCTVAVSYNEPYAVEQHENLNIPHLNGRNAKYLEGPMNNPKNREFMLNLIKGEIQK